MTVTTYVRGSSTGTGRNLVYSTWAANIEVPAYEKMIFLPTLDEGGRPYGTANIRYWDALTPTTIASTAGTGTGLDISNITMTSGTPTVLTYTTTFVYLCVGYNDDTQDAIEVGLDGGIRQNIEQALADACDGIGCAFISSLTNGIGDGSTQGSSDDIKQLAWQLRIASPAVQVGDTTIHACLHPGAGLGLSKSQDFMNAEIRGDSENPQVKGIFMKSGGVLFHFTTKCVTSSGYGEGALYVPDTFAVGWNQKPKMEKQRNGASTFHIGTANLGGRVKWDSRGRFYRTVYAL